MNSAEDRISMVKQDNNESCNDNHDTKNIPEVENSSVKKMPSVPKVSQADNETDITEYDDKKDSETTKSLPKRKSSIWVFVKDKMSLTEKGGTPLNWKMLSLVFLSLFCSSMTLTFLFPFLPEMILFFGYKEEEKGYYAGIVASAVFFGRAFGSYFWGWLSDKKGRKPVMLLTISLNGICCLIFGFTTNWPMAVILRFFNGLVNGTVGTAKTILYEVSDNTNQALGMSAISVAWGSGIVLGPAIGGLLASPARRYPEVFDPDGFFGQFPYVIPSVVVFIISVIGFVLDLIFLPETLGMKNTDIEIIRKKKKDNLSNDDEEGDLVTSAKIAMSVEDLHCESDAAVYHCQIEAEKDAKLQSEIKHTGDSDENNETCKLLGDKDHFQISNDKDNALPNELKCCDNSDQHFESRRCVWDKDQCQIINEKESRSECETKPSSDSDGNTEKCKLLDDEDQKHNCDSDAGIVISVHGENSKSKINGYSTYKNSNETLEIQVHQSEDQISSNSSSSKKGMFSKINDLMVIQLLKMAEVREGIFLYSVLSFAIIGYEEVFTIWASTEKELDGLGFPPEKIGAALAASSVPLIVINFYLFPALAKRFKLKKTFIGCAFSLIFFVTVMPALHLCQNNETLLWPFIIILLMPQKVLGACCFSATALFVNNSVKPQYAGSVNGIAMTITAIARTFAPTVGGSMYAWSITYGSQFFGPPFDVSFSFFVFGVIVWITCIYAVFISESLNKQKK